MHGHTKFHLLGLSSAISVTIYMCKRIKWPNSATGLNPLTSLISEPLAFHIVGGGTKFSSLHLAPSISKTHSEPTMILVVLTAIVFQLL